MPSGFPSTGRSSSLIATRDIIPPLSVENSTVPAPVADDVEDELGANKLIVTVAVLLSWPKLSTALNVKESVPRYPRSGVYDNDAVFPA